MTDPTICATLKIALDRRATSRHDNALATGVRQPTAILTSHFDCAIK